MKCRTGRSLTFNCPGTIKGWRTRCMYCTSWFAARLHSCLFNLITYLLWSAASTVVNVAADEDDGEGGIEDVCKRPPERLEGSPADISSISSNSFFSNKRARIGPGKPRGAPFVQPQQQQMIVWQRRQWPHRKSVHGHCNCWFRSQQLPAIFTY
jgi:hypothetical protein